MYGDAHIMQYDPIAIPKPGGSMLNSRVSVKSGMAVTSFGYNEA